MSDESIEEFGRVLVREVRDAAIRACDLLLRPQSRDPGAARWRATGLSGHEELASTIIADAVDETMFQLLHAIDSGALRLRFVDENGNEVSLNAAADELAGWFIGSGGWRTKYAKERVADDFAGTSGPKPD